MSKTLIDLEKDKFDEDGDVEVKVKNDDADPVKVEIVNADSAVDIQVEVPGTITAVIDDSSGPIDVNITDASIDTNATIQGTPNVAVTNTPTVTVSGSVGVTSASTLDVNVVSDSTNDTGKTKLTGRDGSWEVDVVCEDSIYKLVTKTYQADDNVKVQKNYTAAQVVTLSSSTSVELWLGCHADGILIKNYNSHHTAANKPSISYFTFPTLGDSNKCLKLISSYTGSNLISVVASVVNWTFDDLLAPVAALANGAIDTPNNDAAIGEDICTLTPTGGGPAGTLYTLVLSGTDSANYRLANVTQSTTGTTITAILGDSIVLETAVVFDTGSTGYAHTMTVTSTEEVGGSSAFINFSLTKDADASWQNEKYWEFPDDDVSHQFGGNDSSIHNLWGDAYDGGIGLPGSLDPYTISMWFTVPTGSPSFMAFVSLDDRSVGARSSGSGAQIWTGDGSAYQRLSLSPFMHYSSTDNVNYKAYVLSYLNVGTTYHVVMVKNATVAGNTLSTSDGAVFVNGVKQTLISYDYGSVHTWVDWDTSSISTGYYNGAFGNWTGSPDGGNIIDECATFDDALTDLECVALYNSGVAQDIGSHDHLRGYWRFGDGDSNKDGTGTPDSNTKIYNQSSDATVRDLDLQGYSGDFDSGTSGIKEY